jgi:hypothetical protein
VPVCKDGWRCEEPIRGWVGWPGETLQARIWSGGSSSRSPQDRQTTDCYIASSVGNLMTFASLHPSSLASKPSRTEAPTVGHCKVGVCCLRHVAPSSFSRSAPSFFLLTFLSRSWTCVSRLKPLRSFCSLNFSNASFLVPANHGASSWPIHGSVPPSWRHCRVHRQDLAGENRGSRGRFLVTGRGWRGG